MAIFSQQVEKHVLGGLIKHPQVFADVDSFLNEKDFYFDVHSTIYCVIRDSLLKNERLDKVLLAQKIKNLGISHKDDINIFDYIEVLIFTQITPEATIQACRELLKLRIRRELTENANQVAHYVEKNGDKPIGEIISHCDSIYSEKVASYKRDDEPVNVFENIEQIIEARGNNPSEEAGFLTPYPEFNRLYGGYRNANIYAYVSRAGEGKTTVIDDTCFNITKHYGFKVPVFKLDTEMEAHDIQSRMLSSLTGVPTWYIDTGAWRKNPEYLKLIRAAWPLVKNYKYEHLYVANKSIDQICSLIRRWYYSKVGRGNPAIIAYDYIKLAGEKVGQNWAEHQAIGEKINRLKEVITDLQVPLITAMQLNRSGNNFNKKSADVTDDSTAISLSDRLQWFASFVAIFRRKTLDEVVLDGPEFGTHKLIPLKTRFQGKDGMGHHDFLKRPLPDGTTTYCNNYLNYELKNFRVTEKGSLHTIIEKLQNKYILDKDKDKKEGELL